MSALNHCFITYNARNGIALISLDSRFSIAFFSPIISRFLNMISVLLLFRIGGLSFEYFDFSKTRSQCQKLKLTQTGLEVGSTLLFFFHASKEASKYHHYSQVLACNVLAIGLIMIVPWFGYIWFEKYFEGKKILKCMT